MKQNRQKMILDIIEAVDVYTQEDLLNELKKRGIVSTQATLSRDIRELGLKKKPTGKGGQKYVQSDERPAMISSSYRNVLATGIISVEPAESLIVVKTVSGVAMAVGAALDNMKIEGLVGCIAGDDTLFLAVSKRSMMDSIVEEIKNAAKG